MRAMVLEKPSPIENHPLKIREVPNPKPDAGEILIEISACGICRTDLHTIEGELPAKKLPIIPGHQIVGTTASESHKFGIGERVGIPWLHWTCGECEFCGRGDENLCTRAQFTGYDVDGGYAEYVSAREDFVFPIPDNFSDTEAAPLLCAGAIGFRALEMSKVKERERLGLFGFGASAHLVAQIAVNRGCDVFVFSRGEGHRKLAEKLGAIWTGGPDEEPPEKLHGAIVFAPSGKIVLNALRVIGSGGTVVLAGIYTTPIPEMNYEKYLYHEKTLKSVANCTRRDVREFLREAARIPIRSKIETFKLDDANRALELLKRGEIQGAGVLEVR